MSAVSAAMLKMKADGRLAKFQKKWFGDSVAHRKVVVLLGKTVGEKPDVDKPAEIVLRPLTEEETSLIRLIKPTRRKTTTKLAPSRLF